MWILLFAPFTKTVTDSLIWCRASACGGLIGACVWVRAFRPAHQPSPRYGQTRAPALHSGIRGYRFIENPLASRGGNASNYLAVTSAATRWWRARGARRPRSWPRGCEGEGGRSRVWCSCGGTPTLHDDGRARLDAGHGLGRQLLPPSDAVCGDLRELGRRERRPSKDDCRPLSYLLPRYFRWVEVRRATQRNSDQTRQVYH